MGWQIVRQPNGLFARYSGIVDDFTHCNLTAQQMIDVLTSEYEWDRAYATYCTFEAMRRYTHGWHEAIDALIIIHGWRNGLYRWARAQILMRQPRQWIRK